MARLTLTIGYFRKAFGAYADPPNGCVRWPDPAGRPISTGWEARMW